MSNSTGGQAKPGAAGGTSLIRVDQVPKLPHLSDQEKIQTQARVQQLWDIMNNAAESDARRRTAHQHLTATSQQIMQAMRLYNDQKQAQQLRQQGPPPVQRSQTSPVPVSVPVPATSQTVAASTAAATAASVAASMSAAGNQLSPEVQQQLDAYQFVLPPAMAQGTKQADDWLKEAKNRLGAALQRMQQAKTQKANLQRIALTKQQQGGLSAAEQATFNEKVTQFNKFITESQSFLEKFREQQTQFRVQRAQASTGTPASGMLASQGQSVDVGGGSSNQPIPQVVASSQSQNMSMTRPQGSSGAGIQPSPSPNVPNASAVNSPNSVTGQVPTNNVNPTSASTMPTTPGIAQASNMTPLQNQQPKPQYPSNTGSAMLTAPGAASPALAQPSPHIQQQLPVQSPMGRPGFGGPNAGLQRSSTEPALSAIPGYVLDRTEDGSVLSREKLRELITEILGAGEDRLTADAEDLCISFIDDFVDDLLSQGCKMAKLRGATHLDVRDIQVVLERQYNMRIPGYSTDELRVARRPPAHTTLHQ